jgi:hypothetical protein
MAIHNEDVCIASFSASPGDQVNFNNPTTTTCTITASGTYPFTDGPPLQVPPAGTTTFIKAGLPSGTFNYNVTNCPEQDIKSVIVA